MRIPLNLLSTKLRSDWVEVPAHPFLREVGVGRVKLQEVAGDLFDDLWADCAAAEAEETKQEAASPRDPKKLHEAKAAKDAAWAAIVDA